MSSNDNFYKIAEYEVIPCNFCGGKDLKVLANKDQSGLNVNTCICLKCGLMFVNPRMKPEWYQKYYEEEYRNQRSLQKGSYVEDESNEEVFSKRIKFGRVMAERIKPHIKDGLTIDVGSSTGGVLLGFKSVVPNLKLLGIEPSPVEAEYANNKGVETIVSMFETLDREIPKASNILSTRNLNHLLDPRKFLIWSYNQLETDGRLILAIINFRTSAYKRGSIERAAQIDHVYMYTPETIKAFIESAGFDIVFFDDSETKSFKENIELKKTGLTASHMRIVAKKSNRRPFDKLIIKDNLGREVLKSMSKSKISSYYFKHSVKKIIHKIRTRLHL